MIILVCALLTHIAIAPCKVSSRPVLVISVHVILYCLQSFCFSYLYFYYKFDYKIQSVIFLPEGFFVTYRSGWKDLHPWEKLRRVDPILGYMVFSENNYFIFDGLGNRNVRNRLDELSNGKVYGGTAPSRSRT